MRLQGSSLSAWHDTDPEPDPQQPEHLPIDVEDPDEIAIERAVAGDGVLLAQLTPAEQDEVVRRLTERGKSIRRATTSPIAGAVSPVCLPARPAVTARQSWVSCSCAPCPTGSS